MVNRFYRLTFPMYTVHTLYSHLFYFLFIIFSLVFFFFFFFLFFFVVRVQSIRCVRVTQPLTTYENLYYFIKSHALPYVLLWYFRFISEMFFFMNFTFVRYAKPIEMNEWIRHVVNFVWFRSEQEVRGSAK